MTLTVTMKDIGKYLEELYKTKGEMEVAGKFQKRGRLK